MYTIAPEMATSSLKTRQSLHRRTMGADQGTTCRCDSATGRARVARREIRREMYAALPGWSSVWLTADGQELTAISLSSWRLRENAEVFARRLSSWEAPLINAHEHGSNIIEHQRTLWVLLLSPSPNPREFRPRAPTVDLSSSSRRRE
jgi:hypothetical protein